MARLKDVVKDEGSADIQGWVALVHATLQVRRGKVSFAVALLASLLGLLLAAEGRARASDERHPGGVYLSWVRGPGVVGCPDPIGMQAAIARRLGRDPFLEPPVQFLDAVLRRETGTGAGAGTATGTGISAWIVVITLSDVSGQARDVRTLRSQAPTCASLAEAAAVAMALLIDPGFSSVSEPTVPVAASPVPGAPAPASAWGRPTAWARVLLAQGLLPRAAWGTSLGVELAWRARLGVSVAAVFFPEVRTPKPDPNFAFGVTYASAHLCATSREVAGRVSGTTCAGAHAGLMHATVYFPEATSPGERAFWAFSLEPGVVVKVAGPVAVALSLAGYLLPAPRDFVILGRAPGKDVAFAQPRWAGLGALSVRASW